MDSHTSEARSGGAAAHTDEVLQLKAKVAGLELQLAQSAESVASLRRENADFAQRLQRSSTAVNSRVTTVKDENYQLQKELMAATEQRSALEKQLARAQETAKSLQASISREVQRARDDGERQTIFLRSQLLEQKEMNTALQEKVVAAIGFSHSLRNAGMDDVVSDRLLITSDAVLHRLADEHRGASYKGKYDVTVELAGREMVLSGKRLNVQLLKAEVLQVLNDMYAAATDPTQYVAGARVKDEAQRAESNHLRRTVVTHETTIASLHTALQHAQDRTNQAIKDADEARRKVAVAEEEAKQAKQLRAMEREEHERVAAALRAKVADVEDTTQMAVQSLKAETAVGARYRDDVAQLRDQLRAELEAKEVAERAVYVAAEKLRAAQQLSEEMQQRVRAAEAGAAQTTTLEREVRRLTAQLEEQQRQHMAKIEQLSGEKGTSAERVKAILAELEAERRRSHEIEDARGELQRELAATQQVLRELRDGGRDTAPDGAGGDGVEATAASLTEENLTLRRELQQAFADMRAIAATIKETRSVRERAIADLEKVEVERAQLLEERQQLEVQLIQERMQHRQAAVALEGEIATLREELAHQKRRIEMLHGEYQRKIASLVPSSGTQDSAVAASLPSAIELMMTAEDAEPSPRSHLRVTPLHHHQQHRSAAATPDSSRRASTAAGITEWREDHSSGRTESLTARARPSADAPQRIPPSPSSSASLATTKRGFGGVGTVPAATLHSPAATTAAFDGASPPPAAATTAAASAAAVTAGHRGTLSSPSPPGK